MNYQRARSSSFGGARTTKAESSPVSRYHLSPSSPNFPEESEEDSSCSEYCDSENEAEDDHTFDEDAYSPPPRTPSQRNSKPKHRTLSRSSSSSGYATTPPRASTRAPSPPRYDSSFHSPFSLPILLRNILRSCLSPTKTPVKFCGEVGLCFAKSAEAASGESDGPHSLFFDPSGYFWLFLTFFIFPLFLGSIFPARSRSASCAPSGLLLPLGEGIPSGRRSFTWSFSPWPTRRGWRTRRERLPSLRSTST